MTPLAHRIVKELTLPLKERTYNDKGKIITRMNDVHCFECSEVVSLAFQMVEQMLEGAPVGVASTFLPAPNTWIEFLHPEKPRFRIGYLFRQTNSGRSASVMGADYSGSGEIIGWLKLDQADLKSPLVDFRATDKEPAAFLYALLAIINTPRIIGRRQHMPHRGLERALVRAQPIIGKFPLHAWTEIKLEVAPPKDMVGEGSFEAHLTGQRALHFCRAHLRIRLGRLEIVRSHWRGDASLGIKRSRYKLTARGDRAA